MKAPRIVALVAAFFFVLLAPLSAQAYPGEEGGVSGSQPQPSGGGCYTVDYTVTGEPNSTVTLTVTNSAGDVVYEESATTDGDGNASFTVELCESGTYTATGTDAEGNVLGSTQTVIPSSGDGGGSAGGDDDTTAGGGAGSLPATGSDTRDMLALGGGIALLAVGGLAFVAARRRTA
jgi:LPXTG-motif cell wall-anchored protein